MPQASLTAEARVVQMEEGLVTVTDGQAGSVAITETRTYSLTINDSRQEG
jgi:hypothetical protein